MLTLKAFIIYYDGLISRTLITTSVINDKDSQQHSD